MPVQISQVKDPCKRVVPQTVPFERGRALDHYLDGLLPVHDGLTPVVAVNGRIIHTVFDKVQVKDGDRIAVSARIEISAAAFVGSWLATTLFPASLGIMGSVMGYSIAYGVGFAATMFAMGYGANKLVGLIAPEPEIPGQSSYDQAEQTYGWTALGQTVTEGTPILDGYGVNRVSGQVLSQYIDVVDNKEVLYVLLAVLGRQVDALSDFRVNDQPYTYFRGVSIETRLGTLNDEPIDGFSEVPLQKSVKTKLSYGNPATRTTDGTLVDKLVFIVSAPSGMYYANDSGGLDARSATFTLEYKKSSDSTWILYDTITISGATNEAIIKKYTINNLDSDQYDMRLTRTTADSSGSRTKTDIYWMYWTELIKEEFIYPGIAKWAIKAVALEDLSGGKPQFSCLVHVNTVQVYDTSEWVSKPATNLAWMCYDRLIRNGQSPDRILFDEFLEFAAHNDEDISASEDPEEKRNVANKIISSGNLWDNVQQIARIGQGAIIYRGSDFGVFIDKEEANVDHLFTMGNILDETFKLDYLDEEDRANCVEIEYTDLDRDYTRQPISVHSKEYLESSSISKTASVQINAAVPQKQMVRYGTRLVNQNKYLIRVITFEAFVDSFTCTVGDLFYFQHEVVNYDDQNIGGRIKDAGNDYRVDVLGLENDPGDMTPWVQLDRSVSIQESIEYKVLIRLPDDNQIEKTVLMDPAETDTLFLASPWLTMPDPKDVYAFGVVTSGFKKRWRLSEISRSEDFTAAIVAIEYIPEIYTEDSSRVIEEPTWEQHKQEAIDVMANEVLAYAPDGSYISKINVSWHRSYSDTGASWNVWLEDLTQGSAPVYLDYVHRLQYTIAASLILGHEYRVIIAAGDKGPVLETGNYTTVTILGKEAKPGDVANFTAWWDSIHRAVHFSCTAVNDIDLAFYRIKEGGTWESGVIVKESIESSSSIIIDEGVSESKTYRIKAVDKTGNESDLEDIAVVLIDTSDCPLALPGGLSVVSNSIILDDGRNIVTLLATWNSDSELSDNFAHYEVLLEDMASNKQSMFSTTAREYQWELIPNKQYGLSVRAKDVSGNHTDWSTPVLHTTVKDTQAPAAPTWPVSGYAIGGFKVVGLNWNKNSEYDLRHYVLERSTESDFASDITILGEIGGTFKSDSQGLGINQTYYYRLKAVDSSGNESGYSSIKSATTTQVGSSDIAANAIIAEHIAAGTIEAEHLAAGIITVDEIESETYVSTSNTSGAAPTGFRIDADANTFDMAGMQYDPVNGLRMSDPNGDASIEIGDKSSGEDYCVLNQGDIRYYVYSGSEYLLYKSLKRIESGVANNNDWVTIPGIFKDGAPHVVLSPKQLETYDASAAAQSQTISLDALDIQETATGSMQYKFQAKALLEYASGAGGKTINLTSSMSTRLNYPPYQSAYSTVGTSNYTIPEPNTRRIQAVVGAKTFWWSSEDRDYDSGEDWWLVVYRLLATVTFSYYNSTGWHNISKTVWGTSNTAYNNVSFDTGVSSSDITYIKCSISYNSYNYTKISEWQAYTYLGSYRGSSGQCRLISYSSDLTSTTVVAPGTLNWWAFGH